MKNLFRVNFSFTIFLLTAIGMLGTFSASAQEYKKLAAIPLWQSQKIDHDKLKKTISTSGIFKDVTTPLIRAY